MKNSVQGDLISHEDLTKEVLTICNHLKDRGFSPAISLFILQTATNSIQAAQGNMQLKVRRIDPEVAG